MSVEVPFPFNLELLVGVRIYFLPQSILSSTEYLIGFHRVQDILPI